MNIYKHFLSCILLLSVCFLNAQQDSLVQLTYKKLEANYYANRNKDAMLARTYAASFLKKASLENDDSKIAKSYMFLGNLENYNENYNQALKYIDTCISYCNKLRENKMLLFAYKVKGNIYNKLGDYNNSISYHLKVDSIAKQTNDTLQQMRSNHNIAIIKEEIGNVEEAIPIFLDNLNKLETYPSLYNETFHINTLISLTTTHIELYPEKAIRYNTKVKELSEKSNDIDALSYHYMFKGKIAYSQKQYQKALNSFHKADSIIVSSLNNKGNLFIIYRLRGKILFEQNKYNEAITELEKAKTLYTNKGYQHFGILEIYTLLANCYDKTDQKNKSLENFKLGSSLYEKNADVKMNVSQKIKEKYEIANFKDEIERLTSTLQKDKKSNTILKVTGSFLSLLLIVFVGLYLKSKHTNKKKFTKLLEHINTLEKQQNQVIETQSKTSNTISNEKVKTLLKNLEKFENNHEFLNSKTSLNFVAKKLNSNTSYVSKIINEYKGKSFINYITELRINYALQRIKNDKVFRSYSIKGIAEELGFKSEGSFSRAFKQHTGIYPSYFIKNITANS